VFSFMPTDVMASPLRQRLLQQRACHAQSFALVVEHLRARLVVEKPFPSAESCVVYIKNAWSRAYSEQDPKPGGRLAATPSEADIADVSNLTTFNELADSRFS
jgi:hypothetical protein